MVRIAIAVLVLVAVSACASAGPGGPGGGGGWPANRTFLSTEVTENGVPKPLVEGTRITMTFHEDDRVTINAGCNTMSGAGRIASGVLEIGGLAMTEMGCPDGRMDQDAWVAALITSRPRLTLSGDNMTITGAAATVSLLDRRVADPDRPLRATKWEVDTIFQADSATNVATAAPAVLTIADDGAFEATTGCVDGLVRGIATVTSGQITFTVTEETACATSDLVDEAVRATLNGPVTYEIEAARLRLTRPDGDGLGLTAQP